MSFAVRVSLLLILCLVRGGLSFAQEEKPRASFSVVTSEEGVLVVDSGKKVLFFQQKPKSLKGEYERAGYVHPMWDLDGNVLTEDFPADHKHHRGIFWAWHQLSVGGKPIGDPWLCKDFLSDVREIEPALQDDGLARLRVLSHWKSPLWKDENGLRKTIAEEKTQIVVHPIRDNTRAIDFEVSLLAVEKDVRIGGSKNVKGYGGFCTRLRLPDGLTFRLKSGFVEPIRTSVDESPWLDMTAAWGEDKQLSGVSVLTHPTTVGFPQRWILRQKSSMQNPVFPGRETVSVPNDPENPLVFRYRLVLHNGEVHSKVVNAWQSDFEKQP